MCTYDGDDVAFRLSAPVQMSEWPGRIRTTGSAQRHAGHQQTGSAVPGPPILLWTFPRDAEPGSATISKRSPGRWMSRVTISWNPVLGMARRRGGGIKRANDARVSASLAGV